MSLSPPVVGALLTGGGVLLVIGTAARWLRRRELTAGKRVADAVLAMAAVPEAQAMTVPHASTRSRLEPSGVPRAWWRTAWPHPRQARLRRLVEEQLPDAVDMLANALRAGHSIQSAMEFVGQEMPAPVGPAFLRFHEEHQLGLGLREALQQLQQRLGTADARMLVMAMHIQRETGGNLTEVLGNIGTIIRDRIEFRGQVRVLTAEARLSATVLSLLPIGLLLVIRVVNPGYLESLTSTTTGPRLLLYAAGSLALGMLWLRRIATITA